MPRMTGDLLVRCTGHARKKRDDTLDHFLRRITHLYCSEKGIEKIEGLSKCSKLSVLYLYDNLISQIENLASCSSLTHLYLQNNHITRMTNLSTLHKLTKLYLSGNAITVVEGLEGLTNLTELHIANQRLPEGEKLLFDPRSLESISDSLTVLNVSGNGLDSISDLTCLTELEHLSACDNQLASMRNLSRVLTHLPKLTKLELTGNPVCQKHKYRDRIITMGERISVVDGKEVSDTEKQFLVNWRTMRKARRKQQRHFMEYPDPLTNEHAIPTAKQIVYKAPPPLTMPALPPRQLPRRNKRLPGPPPELSTQTVRTTYQPEGKRERQSVGIKLPSIVSTYQTVNSSTHRILDKMSPLKNSLTQLRPIHAVGQNEDHF